MIHIYCGDGKGKTTASVGLAIRMVGYNKRVLFMQFLKGSYTGELKMLEKCGNITVMRCDKNYGFLPGMTDTDKHNVEHCHNANLKFVLDNMANYDLIVLDEIIASYNYGLADKEIVRKIVSEYSGELVLTGRDPDEWFCERADYISEIKKVKHPYDDGIVAREGIEY